MIENSSKPFIILDWLEVIVWSQFAPIGTSKSLGVDFNIVDVQNLKKPNIHVLRDLKSLSKHVLWLLPYPYVILSFASTTSVFPCIKKSIDVNVIFLCHILII